MHRCKKIISLSITALLIGTTVLYAQKAPVVEPVRPVEPVKPVVPSVRMPTVKTPEINSVKSPKIPEIRQSDNTRYTPGIKKSTANAKPAEEGQTPVNKEKDYGEQMKAASEEILNKFGPVSAADLASLSSQGLVPNVGSLLGGSVLTGQQSGNNEIVLNQILRELNEIKANQKTLMEADYSKLKPSTEPPAILRFVLNNFNILKCCSAVFFSDIENDGTFLLTGDCKTLYNNKPLSETFYMLFKSNGTNEGKNLYTVEISVSQSFEEKRSVLYLFSMQKVEAQRIGNCIKISTQNQECKSDVLIDIGK